MTIPKLSPERLHMLAVLGYVAIFAGVALAQPDTVLGLWRARACTYIVFGWAAYAGLRAVMAGRKGW